MLEYESDGQPAKNQSAEDEIVEKVKDACTVSNSLSLIGDGEYAAALRQNECSLKTYARLLDTVLETEQNLSFNVTLTGKILDVKTHILNVCSLLFQWVEILQPSLPTSTLTPTSPTSTSFPSLSMTQPPSNNSHLDLPALGEYGFEIVEALKTYVDSILIRDVCLVKNKGRLVMTDKRHCF
ncbi:uncharacterized protein LOC115924277 [Strongylocentrotus purpuratus]|uniref:Uncharacterized protein n=1 Tax=Strongylocentrotus purpuratus TaxID=7668 RepID=A0A7M7NY08_STRPU|nr:uncharacterized protein LOC115924277 [Strongylocentrotus purpuratus]